MRTDRVEEPGRMLGSWKEISSYLGRTVRTCQRLESLGLPIHRIDGSPRAHVFAYPDELDAWLAKVVGERERKRKTRRLWISLATGLAVVAAASVVLIGVVRGRMPAREAVSEAEGKSVAVLVLDLGPRPGWEHLPDSIAGAVRNALWQIQGLRVSGRTSSDAVADAVRNRKLDVREAGLKLNVRNLLELGVQIEGENLRVTAELVNTKDGIAVWMKTYDKPIRNIFEIEDQISKSIVDQLKVRLVAGEEAALLKHPTGDIEAYNLYWKGRHLLGQPTIEAPREALRFFEMALARDPKFALAEAGIASVYMNMIQLYMARPTEVGRLAESAVKKALVLDPELAEAHAADAWVQFLYNYNWEAAGKSFRRALELKPGDDLTRGMYAYFLMTRRRFVEARVEIKRALASDPLMPMLSTYSMWIHLYTGRYEEVLAEFQRVEPSFEFAQFGAGNAYLKLGRIDEAVEMFKKGRSLPHVNGRPEAGLAVAYLKKGDRAAAEALYAGMLERWNKSRAGSPVNIAWVAAALGDVDAGFDLLETAVQEHEPDIPAIHIYVEAVMPELARHPRFLAILDKLNLPH